MDKVPGANWDQLFKRTITNRVKGRNLADNGICLSINNE